ncbi:unnamed protein product [Cercopithifilaria johnstoni]|uniref:Protein Wnt n=1 Tax=Cercopithifilaria johnstoni TaxID=2874296 RepID=A0A8J2M5I3_9BILA|nr:unnamed protein product [Cercopithifilaria johnstoni]
MPMLNYSRSTNLVLHMIDTIINANGLLPEAPNNVFRDDGVLCGLLPGLTRKQSDLCLRHRTAIRYVVKGLKAAIHECRNQFHYQRWNCSASHNGFAISHLKIGSKESAYVFALSSAAVSRALARACAQGTIASCSCGSHPKRITKQFRWAGCSDNVKFANNFGRKFMDAADSPHTNDARSMMNLHNNRVGRKAISSNVHRECKCHGVSGSCVMQTCWKVVPKLEEIGLLLRKKYSHAAKVSVSSEGKTLVPRMERIGSRSGRYLHKSEQTSILDNELVYLDDSLDYCKEDKLNDIRSPQGRECFDKCNMICCGRGHKTVRVIEEQQCDCKFVWCCEVKCETCHHIVSHNFCI